MPLKRALGVSMLKLLSKLFNKKLDTSSVPIDTNVSDDEIWEVLHPSGQATLSHKKENLSNFLKFITSHLNKSESQRLTKAAAKASNETGDPFDALTEVISGDDGQKRGQWVFIQVDWKADDEISWQSSEILSLYGVEDKWTYTDTSQYSDVPKVLQNLSEWLDKHGFSLVHLETESDWYCCFIVKSPKLITVKDLASIAGLQIYDADEFASRNPSNN